VDAAPAPCLSFKSGRLPLYIVTTGGQKAGNYTHIRAAGDVTSGNGGLALYQRNFH